MDVVNNEMNTWPGTIQEAIGYLKTSAVVIPLIILLWSVLQHSFQTYYILHIFSIIIYYYGALSHVLKELNKDLQVQLILVCKLFTALVACTVTISNFRNAGKHEHELLKVNNHFL